MNTIFSKRFFWSLLVGIYRKYLSHKYLDKKIKNELNAEKEYYVINTWMHNDSIIDSYFGKLPEYLISKQKNILIVANIIGNLHKIIKKMGDSNSLVIPKEYFIKYRDFLLIPIKVFLNQNKFKLINITDGTDIIYYYYVKRMVKKVDVDTFIYPFENHLWEKICLLAFKKYSPATKTFGYQHASISKSYSSFFVKDNAVLPDRIISSGEQPKSIMEKFGYYPKNLIKVGCGLRFDYLHTSKILPRQSRNTILVPLTISKQESINLLEFIQKALDENNDYFIIVRCHPNTPFSEIEKGMRFKLNRNFIISNDTMLNDLKGCDIVLYNTTTVCMEALMMGLPVVHICLDVSINTDPLFDCNHLKWNMRYQKELIPTIDEIYNLGEKEFEEQQRLAREYVKKYFLPVTDEQMKVFL